MSDCLFCRIVSGEIPCNRVYEDEGYLAFMDIQPVNVGHTLIVPKEHSCCLAEMPDEAVGALYRTANRLARRIWKAVGADGYNLSVNVGEAAGQVVMHTHLHVIPRFRNDGHEHWKKMETTPEEIAAVADRIRNFNE